MTHEATIASENAVHFEAKKTGFGQAQDGWSLTLRIQDDDVPDNVRDARKGTRFMVALVEIDDDEAPKPKSFAQQAKMLARDVYFWDYQRPEIIQKHPPGSIRPEILRELSEQYIEEHCGVDSCAEIIEGTEAGRKFKQLQAEFLSWKDMQEYQE